MATAAALTPTAEQRRVAVQLSEKARQAITSQNYDYGIELLQECCKLDPGSLIYRKALRQTQKVKFKNNFTGSPTFGMATWGKRLRLASATKRKQYEDALVIGESILSKNPWHTPTQLLMAQAAEGLGLGEVAVFILEQARQRNPNDRKVNIPLAQLHERLGNYTQAVSLFELAAKADPTDAASARKVKDLSATETLERGQYEDRTFNPEDGLKQQAPRQAAAAPATPLQQKLTEIETLRAKIAAEPSSHHGYLDLAKVYRREGKWEDARTILENGLAATGSHFEINLALADLEIEPFRKNLRIALGRLEDDPGNAAVRAQATKLHKEVVAREAAYFRQRCDRFPSEVASHLELGIRLAQLGQADEAIPELQQGRKDARLRWKALMFLGHCFRAKHNWPLAKRNYEEALLALPPGEDEQQKELLFSLAKGAADASDWPTALQHGNDLANQDYGYREIGSLLEQWNKRFQGAGV